MAQSPFFITHRDRLHERRGAKRPAYEKSLADVIARIASSTASRFFFLTGVDQHEARRCQQSAEQQGIGSRNCGRTSRKNLFVALWDKLAAPTTLGGPTDPLHKECVRADLQKFGRQRPATGRADGSTKNPSAAGIRCGRSILTEKERGADGEFGPDWQPVEEARRRISTPFGKSTNSGD